MGVSDRRLHVQLTQEAKNASDFSLIRAIFAFAGFVSALRRTGLPVRLAYMSSTSPNISRPASTLARS